MHLQQRITAFVKLGYFLEQFSNKVPTKQDNVEYNDLFFDGFKHQLKLAEEHNGWFTKENIQFAINSWTEALTKDNLEKWLSVYNFDTVTPKLVAIVMAGNIPLVGFHDFLSVLISGHSVLVKQSSNDKHLLPFLAKYLEYVEPNFKGKISFTEEKLENFDAVIATGSNNTARYFEYYFKGKPSIIRNNRNSVAVLTGNETEEDLQNLSEDIFRYYGLGCRSVSKVFVPKNYNFDAFFQAMYHWHPIINEAKYANNYDYNKAVYLMSEFDMLENGFLMIKEDKSYASPIATVFYEFYDDLNSLKDKINAEKQQIQCIVSNGFIENEVGFGHTQKPHLWDYADSIDSVEFLLAI
ncbi:acyl-CoA reductase [Seonamhaeicola marinus]|uniref:Acyl-CoA reductase n=1 Tax=Seonamhaeicola marinus TaxID=1912246 RepID=A0A5D0HMG1_9FLAO|nr:acyl-CoA reductase [Seonamhaeicola marinus]TYA71529.1 acyl-CoA reductase [Seonamhaeicola marinus]